MHSNCFQHVLCFSLPSSGISLCGSSVASHLTKRSGRRCGRLLGMWVQEGHIHFLPRTAESKSRFSCQRHVQQRGVGTRGFAPRALNSMIHDRTTQPDTAAHGEKRQHVAIRGVHQDPSLFVFSVQLFLTWVPSIWLVQVFASFI